MSVPRCENCGRKLGGLGETLCAVCRDVKRQAETRRESVKAARKVAAADARAEKKVEHVEEVAARKLKFLSELMHNGGHVEKACKAAGVSRVQMGRYRDDDPDFALTWEAVQETNIERLEAEADRRALGYREPVFYQGEPTGHHLTKYSDNLLMFRLKALRPEKYRDGPGANKALGAQLTDEELDDALTKMMRRRVASKRTEAEEQLDSELTQ